MKSAASGSSGGPGFISVTSSSGWSGWHTVTQRKSSPIVTSVRGPKPSMST